MLTWNDLDTVLYQNEMHFPDLAVCEHYCGNAKTAGKALELQYQKNGAFDITFDLEDGAPVGSEKEQLNLAADVLLSEANRFRRVGVRVHDPESSFTENEIKTLIKKAGSSVAYITVPKARNAASLFAVLDLIHDVCIKEGIEKKIPVHVLIESQSALKDADVMAAAEPVEVLDFGLMDFVSDFQGAVPVAAMKSPGQFSHPLIRAAREKLAFAALSNGVIASQNVCIDLKNESVIESDARTARSLFGFLRMWSIHPAQIDPILRGMSPEPGEIRTAEAVLKKAMENHMGPVEYEGMLHDRASYRSWWNVLKRAKKSRLWEA